MMKKIKSTIGLLVGLLVVLISMFTLSLMFQVEVFAAPDLPQDATGAPTISEVVSYTYYADPVNGDDVNGNGSSSNPYKTFQKALDKAVVKKDAGYNTKVILKDGTYNEEVILQNSNYAAWYRMDDRSGNTAFDYSGRGNSGTLFSGTTWNANDGALEFDGKAGYVSVPDSDDFDITSKITINMTVKFNETIGNRDMKILEKLKGSANDTPYSVRIGSNSKIGLYWNGQWIESNAITWDNTKIYTIKITHDGSKVDFYYKDSDNIILSSAGSVTNTDSTVASDGELYIGRGLTGWECYFNGSIYDLYVAKNIEVDQSASLIIEAENAKNAIVSGSDVWSNWTQDGTSKRYYATWNYDWGTAPAYYYEYEGIGAPQFPELSRRREMLFVDGELYTQTLSLENMTDKTYYVDEANDRIYLQIPSSWSDLNGHTVEVSERDQLLDVMPGRKNIVLRGIVFQHANNSSRHSSGYFGAVNFYKTDNLLIDNCEINYSNFYGLTIWGETCVSANWGEIINSTNGKYDYSKNITVNNTKVNYNGHIGMWTYGVQNILMSNSEVSYNVWRLKWCDYLDGWASGGFKFMHTNICKVYNVNFFDNYATGLWMDVDNYDIIIDSVNVANNYLRGVFFEYSPGPFLIKDSQIRYTNTGKSGTYSVKEGGLVIELCDDITIQNNVIENNLRNQINVWDWAYRDDSYNFSAVPVVKLQKNRVRDIDINNNKITQDASGYMIEIPNWSDLLNTFACDYNTYSGDAPFSDLITSKTFEQWKTWTGEDQNSDYEIILNNGFESGTASWASFGSGSVATVTSPVYSGTKAGIYSGRTAAWNGPSQDILSSLNASGQGSYDIGAFVQLSSGSDIGNAVIQTIDSSGTHYFFVSGLVNNTSYTNLSGIVNVTWTGTLTSAKFYICTDTSTADIYIDDCTLQKTEIELLQNDGFESGTASWASFGSGSVATVTSPVYSGTKAGIYSGRTAAWNGPSQDILSSLNANGQGSYDIGAFVQLSSGSDIGNVVIQTIDSSGTHYFFVSGLVNNTSYTNLSGIVNVTWTGTLTSAKFYICTDTSTADIYADDCTLQKIN
ncbi:carbohydrate binding domain-containing protein [Vallitalea guaymasensis]|uniref:Carbohydrate binding domain-containing protein n=1 Tax=Vallitalea guaymasensis TaxID=1185412 RepID=A0A8J8MEV5_9FIRM|nr:carbohydrate binding domain-containing protein [Vallitalea guaymasensis]QUH31636.1 carbohydrate binding domain-containing protein [Vallitalea guaymasensis]